jgi:hypothetical protein
MAEEHLTPDQILNDLKHENDRIHHAQCECQQCTNRQESSLVDALRKSVSKKTNKKNIHLI